MIFAPSCEYNYFKIKGSNKQTTTNIILNSDYMPSSVLSILHSLFYLILPATQCYRQNEVWVLYYLQLQMRKLRLGKVK